MAGRGGQSAYVSSASKVTAIFFSAYCYDTRGDCLTQPACTTPGDQLRTAAACLCAGRRYRLLRLPREAHSGVIPRSPSPKLIESHSDASGGVRTVLTGSRKHITQPFEVTYVENRRVWCRAGGVRNILRSKIEKSAGCVRPPFKHHSAKGGIWMETDCMPRRTTRDYHTIEKNTLESRWSRDLTNQGCADGLLFNTTGCYLYFGSTLLRSTLPDRSQPIELELPIAREESVLLHLK